MPDTYISQFSGEEIDSALRAAQIISGADTPAELRKKLEIRGDTIPVSATDPTPVSEALTASGGGINPNLLDNWYFGNPTNQRGGYYVPQGAIIYSDSSLSESNKIGPAAYACMVVEKTSTYVKVQDAKASSSYYYAAVNAAIPGYCGDRYTVDRWHLTSDGVLTVEDEGIRLTSGALFEPFEYELSSSLKGKTVTYSFFFADNTLVTKSAVIPSAWGNWDSLIEIGDIQLVGLESGKRIWARYSSTTTAIAAKLELGSTQTLAHKEGDKWVLNEIPDFGEQLRRCQMYYLGDTQRDGYGKSTSNNEIYVVVPSPATMRAKPVIASSSKWGNLISGDGEITGISSIEVAALMDNLVILRVVTNSTISTNKAFIMSDTRFALSADL